MMDRYKSSLLHLLVSETNRLESSKDLNAPQVSKANVEWHLSHILLVAKLMLNKLNSSNPNDYKPEFNLYRIWYFFTGNIPRGKAQAPKSVNPESVTFVPSVHTLLSEVEALLQKNVVSKQHVRHPLLGVLNRKLTYKFLTIHSRHHLKIVNDILAAQVQQ